MSIFTGAGVALVTPFKEDLSVDYDQLEKFIDYKYRAPISRSITEQTVSLSVELQERLLQCLMTNRSK